MATLLEEMERERHYILGICWGAYTYYPSVGEKYRFGYDPKARTSHSHESHRPGMDRGRSNSSARHRPRKEPTSSNQVVMEGVVGKKEIDQGKTNQESQGRPNIFQRVTPRISTCEEPTVEFPYKEEGTQRMHVDSHQQSLTRDSVASMPKRWNF